MDKCDRRTLKAAAANALGDAQGCPKKLVLLHTGAVLLVTLLLLIADSLLDSAIAATGGLGGLATRSLLTTVQSCLRLVQMVALPFWQMGYLYVTLKFARGQAAQIADLTFGFRRFFPVLRLQLLQSLLFIGIALLSTQVGAYLFMMTPWAQPIMKVFAEAMQSSDPQALTAAMDQVMQGSYIPLLICYGIVFLVMATPVFYRLRLAEYLLLDDPNGKAIAAMRTSRALMRGSNLRLLKLDLSFWWFYALDLLVSVITYLDVLLLLLGVTLPLDATALYYISFVLYAVCQLALYAWRRNHVQTTYALFYERLKNPLPVAVSQNVMV